MEELIFFSYKIEKNQHLASVVKGKNAGNLKGNQYEIILINPNEIKSIMKEYY